MKKIYIGTFCDECFLLNLKGGKSNPEYRELCALGRREKDEMECCYLPFGIWLKIKIKLLIERLKEE